jgi:hypothetical protein
VLQDMLAGGSPEIRERVLMLAAHDDTVLTDDSLLTIARSGGASASIAVGIAAERGVPDLSGTLGQILLFEDPRASIVAARTMLRHKIGDPAAARSRLRSWLDSGNPTAVATVLRLVQDDSEVLPAQTLYSFLRHPAPLVRCAALQAVAARKDLDSLPEIIAALADAHCLRAARLALSEMPAPAVVGSLMTVISDSADERLRCPAIRVLRDYADGVAEDEIAAHLRSDDLKAWLEFADLLRAVRKLRPLQPNVASRARQECTTTCAKAYLFDAVQAHLDGDPDAILLRDHMTRRYTLATGTALRLAALRYPSFAVDACLRAAASGDRATLPYVMELLETTLDGDDRRLLAPLIEAAQVERRRSMMREMFAAPKLQIEEEIQNAAYSKNRWEAIVATDYLTRKGKLARAAVVGADTTPSQEPGMYSILEKTIILKSSEIFGSLPAENLAALSAVTTEVRLPAGAVLFREGEPGDSLYLVTSGRVHIVKGGSKIAVVAKGTCFGEMAVLDQSPRSADAIIGDEAAVLLRIGSEEFYEVLAENPALAQDLIRLLSRRLREATARIAQVQN